jgi:succinoglycan biosynthesis protein ExoM
MTGALLVAIPHGGSDDDTLRLITSIRRCDEACAILVVINHVGCELAGLNLPRVDFLREPRRGYAHGRNLALEHARTNGFAAIAFLDDDQVVSSTWMDAVRVQIEGGSNASAGPVISYGYQRSRRIELVRPRHATGYKVAYAGLGNFIIAGEALASGLEFDAAFNEAGGEDTAFCEDLRARGFSIEWADDAVAYEPLRRVRTRDFATRGYREGKRQALFDARQPGSARGLAGVRRVSAAIVGLGLAVFGLLGKDPSVMNEGVRRASRLPSYLWASVTR